MTSAPRPALLSFLLKLSSLGVFMTLLVDFVTYSGAIQHNFLISPLILLGGVLVFHLLIRAKWGVTLSTELARTQLLVIAPTVLFVAVGMMFLEEYSVLFPNYFFDNFGVHYQALPAVAIAAAAFGLAHATWEFFQQSGRTLYFLVTFWLIIGAGLLHLTDWETYYTITREDALIENLTSLGFLVAGGMSLLMTRHKHVFAKTQRHQRWFVAACVGAAVALFVVAGEEISWGQRLFGWKTPEAIVEQNLQQETNLHNLETFWPFVYPAYRAIGLYGIVAGLIAWLINGLLTKKARLQAWIRLLSPEPFLALNFLIIVVYVWLRYNHGPWRYVLWEEASELLLVIGIATHLIQRYCQFGRPQSTKKKA